ncbi:MAG TPA: SWIM zinc finger family protein [Thermoanaerobaculia bacterium]|nr:SWIM zinc finger family protein [Thermoanaerobaculia bacterium]
MPDDDTPWWLRERPAKRIAVQDGIKARSKRGAFAKQWWAQRWIAVLEGFNLGARLQRGRTYARGGQVLGIDVQPGRVESRVQGSRRDPYRVSIAIKPFTPDERARFSAALSASPLHLAKLLAGEMPQDIETVLEQQRVSLFPARQSELTTECSCPDWSNPCKHIAAVYYLLGEEFDRDPFLLLQVRGITRDDLAGPAPEFSVVGVRPQPHLTDFWEGSRPSLDLIGDIDPRGRLALLERLGPFPFWRSERTLAEVVGPILEAASL